MDTKIEQRAPGAPLYMPPFTDFVAWLRANPDFVFMVGPALSKCCPIGVFARMHNAGESVSMGLCEITRDKEGTDGELECLRLPSEWRYARFVADDQTDGMKDSITAASLLKALAQKPQLKEFLS